MDEDLEEFEEIGVDELFRADDSVEKQSITTGNSIIYLHLC
jgi:hypothetical protein